MNIFSIAKLCRKIFWFLGRSFFILMGWFNCYVGYSFFIFIVYCLDFGIDYRRLPTFKQFRVLHLKFWKAVLFPNEKLIRNIGYYFVLPLLKAEKEEDNPVASMFSKYLNTRINGGNVAIAHEYIDSIHRKNTYFTIVTFGGLAFIYGVFAGAMQEISDFLGLIGGLSTFTGILDSLFAPNTYFTAVSPLFITISFFTWFVGTILDIFILIFGIASVLCVFWGFKEIKNQNHIRNFIEENLSLMCLSLNKNFEKNEQMLENIEFAKRATIESVTIENDDNFLKSVNNFVRLER